MILNSTAICNRIWTVPCWLVAQVKTSSVQKFSQIRVKTPTFPRDMPQSIILSLIVVCNFLLKVGNVDYIFESNISLLFLFFFFLFFFLQPCHECMAIGYKRCYKCYGRGRVRITDSFHISCFRKKNLKRWGYCEFSPLLARNIYLPLRQSC